MVIIIIIISPSSVRIEDFCLSGLYYFYSVVQSAIKMNKLQKKYFDRRYIFFYQWINITRFIRKNIQWRFMIICNWWPYYSNSCFYFGSRRQKHLIAHMTYPTHHYCEKGLSPTIQTVQTLSPCHSPRYRLSCQTNLAIQPVSVFSITFKKQCEIKRPPKNSMGHIDPICKQFIVQ